MPSHDAEPSRYDPRGGAMQVKFQLFKSSMKSWGGVIVMWYWE
jgi:hypothetical protein